ncbi:hypothetical protein ACFE04_027745 [Oxalis oulophora]
MPQCFHREQSRTDASGGGGGGHVASEGYSGDGRDVNTDGRTTVTTTTTSIGETLPGERIRRGSIRGTNLDICGLLGGGSEGTTPRSTPGVKSPLSWIRHYRVITNCDSSDRVLIMRYYITIIVLRNEMSVS